MSMRRSDVRKKQHPNYRTPTIRMRPPRTVPYRITLNSSSVAAMSTGMPDGANTGTRSRSAIPGGVHLNAPYVAAGVSADGPTSQMPSTPLQAETFDNYGKLPLSFEQNVGQFDERVDFVARTGG